MSLKRITPPSELMTLERAKLHLRVGTTDEDLYITDLIDVVADAFDGNDGAIGKALVSQEWRYSGYHTGVCIDLTLTPVIEINTITYYDSDNVQQSLSISDYQLYGDDEAAYLRPKLGKSWPSTYARPDALTITFMAGFGDVVDVPPSIIHAALLLIAHYYEHRESVTEVNVKELPQGIDDLLSRHKKGWIGG